MATLPGGLAAGLDADLPEEGSFHGSSPGATQGPVGPAALPAVVKFHGINGHFIRPGDAALVVVYRYLMRADDANCPGTTRYWIVTGDPDLTAAEYVGAFCGGAVNFTNIHVALAWLVPVT